MENAYTRSKRILTQTPRSANQQPVKRLSHQSAVSMNQQYQTVPGCRRSI